jgi:hypothetical protein
MISFECRLFSQLEGMSTGRQVTTIPYCKNFATTILYILKCVLFFVRCLKPYVVFMNNSQLLCQRKTV